MERTEAFSKRTKKTRLDLLRESEAAKKELHDAANMSSDDGEEEEEEEEEEEGMDVDEEGASNPLLVDGVEQVRKEEVSRKAKLWFSQPIFQVP